jgi:ubiquinone/menaquinone biosynthesis C-methylase UbiE
MPLSLIEGSAEAIPIDDRSIDTVVTTWTMCSIPVLEGALREMRRVLKPGGRLLFVEHGRAPEPRVRWFQDRFTPVWKRFSGGCHLNRAIEDMVGTRVFASSIGTRATCKVRRRWRSCTRAVPDPE